MVNLRLNKAVHCENILSYEKPRRITREELRKRFPEGNTLSLTSIWSNVWKFERGGTSQNRNKDKSGRKRTGKSEENVDLMWNRSEEHPAGINARRNRVGLPSLSTFNRVTRLDCRIFPYRMRVRHQLFHTTLTTAAVCNMLKSSICFLYCKSGILLVNIKDSFQEGKRHSMHLIE